jgi:hypothetical protein
VFDHVSIPIKSKNTMINVLQRRQIVHLTNTRTDLVITASSEMIYAQDDGFYRMTLTVRSIRKETA